MKDREGRQTGDRKGTRMRKRKEREGREKVRRNRTRFGGRLSSVRERPRSHEEAHTRFRRETGRRWIIVTASVSCNADNTGGRRNASVGVP